MTIIHLLVNANRRTGEKNGGHRSCLRGLAGSVYVTGEDAVTSGRVDVNANSDTQCSHAY